MGRIGRRAGRNNLGQSLGNKKKKNGVRSIQPGKKKGEVQVAKLNKTRHLNAKRGR